MINSAIIGAIVTGAGFSGDRQQLSTEYCYESTEVLEEQVTSEVFHTAPLSFEGLQYKL